VFVTNNGGASWQDVSNTLPDYFPISRITSFNNRLLATLYDGNGYETLYYSDNGGAQWHITTVVTPVNASFRNFCQDGNKLWAATLQGVMLGTDSG
jgi:photosystem II stability/assembly factor-like uncharacterized protein